MENKIHKNIFECTFDSFELDDAFILDEDEDLWRHKINTKNDDQKKKLSNIAVKNSEMLLEENKHFGDISLFLEDLNESDFFECNNNKNKKKHCSEVTNNETKIASSNNNFSCSSPILKFKPKNNSNKLSLTPSKVNNSSDSEEKKTEKPEENFLKTSKCASLEADLFDDWGSEVNSQKDSITLSQAFKLIEEAELERESNEKEKLDTSIDLLTGNPVGSDLENLFADSFSLPSSVVKSKTKKESLNDSLIICEESDTESRPPVAQKLNFETKEEKNNFGINFNSDDDFDFLTQELLKKPKSVQKTTKVKSFSLDESSESTKRSRKCRRIIESDSDDDVKFNKSWSSKETKKVKNFKRTAAREFLESEAEVSDVDEVSSDESEEEGDYDSSFVDEELYLTQNYLADMTAKYLESVQSPNRPGRFKIPAAKPYNPEFVFSQSPEEKNTEYELDSFCVNEVEEEVKSELSDLEIAENILEMDRKRRKRTLQRSLKIK